MLEELQAAYSTRTGHGVVHEAPGKKLARLVIHRDLVEHLPRALREAALHLPLDDLVIDEVAGVIARDIRHDLCLAGVRRDLDFGDVAAVREARAELVRVREIHLARLARREALDGYLAVGSLDAIFASSELYVGLCRLERFGGERHALLHELVRAEEHHPADREQ